MAQTVNLNKNVPIFKSHGILQLLAQVACGRDKDLFIVLEKSAICDRFRDN